MTLSRRRLLTAAVGAGAYASIGVLRWPGDAAQFTYKVANDQTPTHPMNLETAAAIKRIRDASGGQLDIKLFPNSMLGGDPQMLAQLRSGAIEFLQVGNNVLGAVIPASALLSIPFTFRSVKEYEACANGPLGVYLGSAAQNTGLRKFESTFFGGFFQIQNRLRPVNEPGDLAGMKIRVPPGPIDVGTFKTLGAAPTVVTLGEVYTALQTHLIDGIEVPLATVRNFKFYEQTKYCSLTNHSALAYLLLANSEVWERLPKALQAIVDREFGVAANAAGSGMQAQDAGAQSALIATGMVFNSPVLEPFTRVIRDSGLYRQWRDQYDPKGWEALEKTTGKLI